MKDDQPITRRQALMLGAGMLAGTVGQARAEERLSVVELYTSQGCNSCPPADAYMEELARQKGVLALTFNVDYWDYLGWRDTLGSKEFSQRQYDYAKSRGDMDVYTPQMIVDGRTHYVGSNRAAIDQALKRSAGAAPAQWVPIKLKESELEVEISVEGGGSGHATLWVMALAPRLEVAIEKGENAGKTIAYSNVVRKLVPAGMWHGSPFRVTQSKNALLTPECKGCVALLQSGHVGPIIGIGTWGEVGGLS
jgi:hypothetical protein